MASEAKLLSAAETTAARAVYADNVAILKAGQMLGGIRAEELCRWLGRLLAHLDALHAPADGEALGRDLYLAIHGHATGRIFDTLPYEARDRMNAAALALYQRGVAAGLAKGEEERVQLVAMLARWETAHGGDGVTPEESHGAVRDELAERDATIARLTAELAAARDCGQADICATPPGCARHWEERCRELAEAVASFQRNSGCVDGYTIGEALAKIGASLGRTPTEGIPDAIERLKKARDDARLDGARVEREAIVKQVRHWASYGRDGMPVVDGDTSLVDWIATEIAESADKGGEGGAG